MKIDKDAVKTAILNFVQLKTGADHSHTRGIGRLNLNIWIMENIDFIFDHLLTLDLDITEPMRSGFIVSAHIRFTTSQAA
jgi:hypothetical protein